LNDWAQAYLDAARVRFTGATYNEKRSMFKRFFTEINPELPVSNLKPGDVLSYIIKQKEARSGYAANKDRKNLVAAWNWGMKYMNPPLPGPNPCLVDRMPEERQPRYVPPEEDFWKVYGQAEGQDKVMLLALLHLAARKGELFRLTWSDVDFGNNSVRLTTRKRKDGSLEHNWIPMTGELRKAMLWWWENRPFKGPTNVFLCLDDTPFCREYYGEPFLKRLQFMRRLCDRAGVKRFGFHAIRHLTATTLYKLGYEVAVIQTILRHKSPSTTERYLKNLGLEERARSALEDLSSRRAQVFEIRPHIQKIVVPSFLE
jgi:integrase